MWCDVMWVEKRRTHGMMEWKRERRKSWHNRQFGKCVLERWYVADAESPITLPNKENTKLHIMQSFLFYFYFCQNPKS